MTEDDKLTFRLLLRILAGEDIGDISVETLDSGRFQSLAPTEHFQSHAAE